jgi:valyl-tRNA synthetase
VGAAIADDESASARGALRHALDVQLRLFAPFLPFVTEEAWSWWQDGSVHAAAWPSAEVASGADAGDPVVLATAAAVLGQVRKAKTEARLSIRAEAARVVVRGPDEAAVRASESDLRAAGNIADFSFEHAPELGTEITLAEAVAS